MQELKFIDCNLSASLIIHLMDKLVDADARLRSLAIVNNTQTPASMAATINFVDSSTYLRELDLSWTSMPPSQWLNLLEIVKSHSSLRKLNLSNNRLTEE